MCAQQSDIHIARNASKKAVDDIADELNIPKNYRHSYGHHICKIDLNYIEKLPEKVSSLRAKLSNKSDITLFNIQNFINIGTFV